MKKESKIAFFIPSLSGGGAQRVFVNLANYFAEKGQNVDLVLAQKEGPYLEKISDKVNIVNLNSSRILKSLLPLVKYLKREQPSTLMSGLNHCNIISVWAKCFPGVSNKVIITQHNYFSISNKENSRITGKFIPPLARIFYKKADGIVCVSNGVKKDLIRTLKISESKIGVIYNPIYKESILKKANEEPDHPFLKGKDNKIILGMGRLAEQKDFSTLIKAFYKLNQKVKNTKLIILGEGEKREELEKQIQKLNLEDEIDLLGFKENPYAYMKKVDVFVLSSKWEGFGNVIVEALACGTSVVSTDCTSGPSEILEDGKYGKLVPVGDSEALAKAIEGTLDNPMDSEKLISRAKDFSVKKISKQYLKVVNLE